MKLAILSDIHGNLPALEVVLNHIDDWGPDHVFVNGDIVNRGPWPAQCLAHILERCRRLDWRAVRGNHEDYVISVAGAMLDNNDPRRDLQQTALWTYEQLPDQVSTLAAMPFQIRFAGPDGLPVLLVHASVHSNRDSILPDIDDADLVLKMGGSPRLFATAHTHRPFVRQLPGTLALNSGSVGMSFDGDYRATYAQVTWQSGAWLARLVRLEYDMEQTIRGFEEQGFLAGGGAIARVMLRELQLARALVYDWDRKYSRLVLDGMLSMEQSVARFLRSLSEENN